MKNYEDILKKKLKNWINDEPCTIRTGKCIEEVNKVYFDFMLTLTNEMMDVTNQKFKHCACLNTK